MLAAILLLSLAQEPLQPVMQMLIKFRIKTADGAPLSQEIRQTIHSVPP